MKPEKNIPSVQRFLTFLLLPFALLLLTTPAFAESRVNGFFRTNLVRAGVFELDKQAPRFTKASASVVPLGSKKRQASALLPRQKSRTAAQYTQASASASANEWDVSALISSR